MYEIDKRNKSLTKGEGKMNQGKSNYNRNNKRQKNNSKGGKQDKSKDDNVDNDDSYKSISKSFLYDTPEDQQLIAKAFNAAMHDLDTELRIVQTRSQHDAAASSSSQNAHDINAYWNRQDTDL